MNSPKPSLDQHQVVAVYDLVKVLAAQNVCELAALAAADAQQGFTSVVAESAGHHQVLTADGDSVAETEVAADFRDSAGQQAAAPPEGAAGAGVHHDFALRGLLSQPGLAGGRMLLRQETGSAHLAARQRLEPGPAAADYQGLDSRLAGDAGRAQLGHHAAGPALVATAARQMPHLGKVTDDIYPSCVRVPARIVVVKPFHVSHQHQRIRAG